MRELRLHQLRGEFEAAYNEWLDYKHWFHSVDKTNQPHKRFATYMTYRGNPNWALERPDCVERIAEWYEATLDGDRHFAALFPSAELARRYIIARDFNVFDVGEADMLWKLQNGGAQ
ncbi:hypothetical protein MOP88_07370 [Sphingomonas sp. WKB10]|nr:hypothetical protein [Sphingomonas sp. WKB10]